MIPVQEFTLKTKKELRFKTYIEKHSENAFRWSLYGWDPKLKISGGFISQTSHSDSIGAYKEMIDYIVGYVSQRKDNDTIEFIDNPCNCELVDSIIQKELISDINQFFPVKVNGQ